MYARPPDGIGATGLVSNAPNVANSDQNSTTRTIKRIDVSSPDAMSDRSDVLATAKADAFGRPVVSALDRQFVIGHLPRVAARAGSVTNMVGRSCRFDGHASPG